MDQPVGNVVMSDAVIEALEEQVACYRRLAKLAEQQHEHVQHAQTERLLEVLCRRQEVLDDVARLERDIAPARRKWSEYAAALDNPQRQRAELLLGETRRLLEQITAADRDDALMLQQRKLNLGRQISAARTAGQVNRNYAAAAYGVRSARVDVGG
ncbi:MAG: hypothetical protein IT446_02165 [Phycisphaerales bacterium]|nr:hypothetical protein [Phycisphaerales bacterium]